MSETRLSETKNKLDFIIGQLAQMKIQLDEIKMKKKVKDRDKKAKSLFYREIKLNQKFIDHMMDLYKVPMAILDWRFIKRHSDEYWDNSLDDATKQDYLIKANKV